ncbi:MAG: hypothetical protein KJ648_07070 [Candidatus Omnitrophica bacterium]|nr:hypothetical protein [Candidatus Omnitrophota bacterium]MBU1767844.1 hypothetical protein [Candidatus Omnitrophota bacterium]
MTQFLRGSFSVGDTPGLDHEEQQRRWDQTFGKKEDSGVATESKPEPDELGDDRCAHGVSTCDLCSDRWNLKRRALLAVVARLDRTLGLIEATAVRAQLYAESGVRDDEALKDITDLVPPARSAAAEVLQPNLDPRST